MQGQGLLRVLVILLLAVFYVGQVPTLEASKQDRAAATQRKKMAGQRLPRYNGPKPSYHINGAHVPGHPGFKRDKTPLPKDAYRVYKKAVPNDPNNPTAWFGKNADGQIYRFSNSKDGTMHFSGIDGVGDGVQNLTNYARARMEQTK